MVESQTFSNFRDSVERTVDPADKVDVTAVAHDLFHLLPDAVAEGKMPAKASLIESEIFWDSVSRHMKGR